MNDLLPADLSMLWTSLPTAAALSATFCEGLKKALAVAGVNPPKWVKQVVPALITSGMEVAWLAHQKADAPIMVIGGMLGLVAGHAVWSVVKGAGVIVKESADWDDTVEKAIAEAKAKEAADAQ